MCAYVHSALRAGEACRRRVIWGFRRATERESPLAPGNSIRAAVDAVVQLKTYAHTHTRTTADQRDASRRARALHCVCTTIYCAGHRHSIMCLTNTTTMSDTNYALL